jgi:hypothetical protein
MGESVTRNEKSAETPALVGDPKVVLNRNAGSQRTSARLHEKSLACERLEFAAGDDWMRQQLPDCERHYARDFDLVALPPRDRLGPHAEQRRDLCRLEARNAARAPTVDDAHHAWMANARQRANILSVVVNQVGVGVIVDDRATFATEVFVHLGPKIDPVQVARTLRGQLPTTLKGDADLASIAQEFAERLAAGATRYTKIHRTITAVADVADVDAKAVLGGFPGDDVGVGVAQGTHPELGDGAVWVVVLLGEELHSYQE